MIKNAECDDHAKKKRHGKVFTKYWVKEKEIEMLSF